MAVNPNFPIYLGVSQEFFSRMQDLNVLDGDACFTTSMGLAEKHAKEFSEKSERRAKDGIAGLGRVLASIISNKPIITKTNIRGVVIKFNTEKLMKNYQVLEFGEEIRVSTEVVQSVMMYVSGFYEVIDIEELKEGDLYA